MAIENGVQNAELGYILDPAFQIEGLNGKPVVGGWICIYEAGTDNKYISYENFDGAQNPFKVPLKSDGRAVILGDPSLSYDIYCYDSYGNQLFSRLNVQCNVPGTINLSGADTRIKNTDGTLDISLRTQANNVREYTINTRNKELGVESPLYFARNDESATIIGFSGDGYLTEDKFEYDNNNNITAYNHSAFASNGQTYSAGTNIDITDNVISVTGLPDIENAISSAVTNVENKFEYNENNYITAYNNSAFAGTNYSAGDYVSIENNTISVTGLQPSGDYATKTDLSGKQDTLSAGDGISIINNVISVTSQGGGIEQVNHDDTLSGDGNSTPLGIANAEEYVKQDDLTGYQPSGDYYSASNPSGFITSDDLTGYATTSLVSSVSSELYSAISGISGDFELVAGSGVELVDDPTAKTTTINVTAQGSNTISYSAKPTDNPIYADKNDLKNVNSIQGKSNLAIIPSGVLQIPNVITAVPNSVLNVPGVIISDPGGLTANGLSANTNGLFANDLSANTNGLFANGLSANANGLTANGLTADVNKSGFSANGISAGKSGPLFIEGQYESICANNSTGFTFSSQNTAFGTAQLGTAKGNSVVQMYAPKFEARNISGAGFSIEASGAKGYDESGNVVWDTNNPQIKNIISYSDTKTAQGGLNGNIILTMQPSTNASNLTSSPYVIMDAAQASYFAAYGPSAQTPTVRMVPGTITLDYAAGNAKTTVGYNDVKQELSGSSWTLTGSIQKRELEYDANTSAITAIAGSAIGGTGGGELPEAVSAATDYVTANSANIDATVSNVSANSGVWGGSALPISAGPGISLSMVDGVLVISTAGGN